MGGDLLSAIRAGKKLQSRAAARPPKPKGGGDLLSQIRAGRNLKSGAERKQAEPVPTQGSLLDEIRNAKKTNLRKATVTSAPVAQKEEPKKKGGIFDILARRAVLSKSSSSDDWEDSDSD
jgi:hypothetical protein